MRLMVQKSLFQDSLLLMVQKSGYLTRWGKGSLATIFTTSFIDIPGGWQDFWTINSRESWHKNPYSTMSFMAIPLDKAWM